MKGLEVSGAVRLIYGSLGVKGLIFRVLNSLALKMKALRPNETSLFANMHGETSLPHCSANLKSCSYENRQVRQHILLLAE